ncbi:extracellular solute-binding protein [Pseudogracilibacillus auburnensis]|uniref:extracellular solute-binding protein n=1 Tax=Pseudogracilibacillus auburnensis TaxID=1494959 RepID=UPI001A9724D2|nr:extracellular solute-binding protein [Pseudogracilibacillus auburnensis]MBO1005939.1 extracellular solute-binding protein [Pseudogracilibacillus auburnensis]
MKFYRAIFSIILLLSMMIIVACSQGEDDATDGTNESTDAETETSDEKEADSGDSIVLKVAIQNDDTPGTQALIDAFNESQDKYTVEWDALTNDSAQMHDQLLNSLTSGSSEYDVISMDVVWAGEFAGAGFLEPIDVFMKDAGLSKDQFNAGSMDSGNYTGKQYTLPLFPDLGLLYYRTDIVSDEDAAKLESSDYTYEDLYDMAENYVGEDGTEYGFLYQSKQYEGLTVNVTEFTKSYTEIEKGLEMMHTFTEASFSPKDLLNFTEAETHTNFEQGNAVFARNWPYQFGRIQAEEDGVEVSVDQVGIAPLPNGGSVGGWLLGINKHSEHVEGAWEFISFAAGEEGQKVMSTEGGYIPGFNALLEDDEVLSSNELLSFPGFQVALQETIARPVSPEYNKVSDLIQIDAHKYLSSGEDLEEISTSIEEVTKVE